MKNEIITTAVAMAITALIAFQPMTASRQPETVEMDLIIMDAALKVCRATAAIPATVVPAFSIPV